MTEIRWYWEEDDFGISAEGHAEFNPGNDIVCSAISALLQTLWAGLEVCCFTPVEHKQESGVFKLTGSVYGYKERVIGLFDSILFGLEQIAERYPDNVKIERVKGEGETPSDTLYDSDV